MAKEVLHMSMGHGSFVIFASSFEDLKEKLAKMLLDRAENEESWALPTLQKRKRELGMARAAILREQAAFLREVRVFASPAAPEPPEAPEQGDDGVVRAITEPVSE